MHQRDLLHSVSLILIASLLVACGGGGSSNVVPPAAQMQTTFSIVVSPSLGKVTGAGAQAFDNAGQPLSGEVDTDDSGVATLEIPASHSAPLLVRLRGKTGATYYDEGTGQDADFPDGQEIRAWMPSPTAAVGVSILTELAVRLVEAAGGAVDAALIDAANEQIRAALAPEVADLLTPPTIVDAATAAGALDDSDAGRLAARLGALANLASGDATPALTVLRQLADDVVDGVIDGIGAEGEQIATVYAPASFAADFVRAVQDFAEAFGNAALRASAETAAAATDLGGGGSGNGDGDSGGDAGGDTGGDAGGGSGDGAGEGEGEGAGEGEGSGDGAGEGAGGFVTEPATVAPDLVGTYTLVYFDSPSAGRDPFAEGQEVQATVTANNTLTIDAIGPLVNPFVQSGPAGGAVNPAEIIWNDPATGLFYALSRNDTGVFNEINVGDPTNPQTSGFAGFVGQLREASSGPSTEAGQAAAAFTGLGTNSGDFRVIRSCSGSECPDTTALGEAVQIVVDGDSGRVTFGSIVIDPDAEGYDFDDQNILSGVEPRLQATAADGMGGTLELRVYPAQFVGGGPPVAGVQLTRNGNSVYAEFPEALRGGPVNNYFTDFAAATTMPVKLTYVADDVGGRYTGKGNALTSAPSGVSPLCRSFEVQGVVGPTESPAASSTFRPQFAWISGTQRVDAYEAKFSRVQNVGGGAPSSTLTFLGGQFVLLTRGGDVRLDEGFIDATSPFLTAPRDQATSVQSDIDAACAGFVSLGGTVSLDNAGEVSLEITDTSSGTTIYRQSFVFASAGSLAWDELLPGDLAYEISASAFTGAGGTTCATTEATGTLTTAVSDVAVTCSTP